MHRCWLCRRLEVPSMPNWDKLVRKHEGATLEPGEEILATLFLLTRGGVMQAGVAGGVSGAFGGAGAATGMGAGRDAAVRKATETRTARVRRHLPDLLRSCLHHRPASARVRPGLGVGEATAAARRRLSTVGAHRCFFSQGGPETRPRVELRGRIQPATGRRAERSVRDFRKCRRRPHLTALRGDAPSSPSPPSNHGPDAWISTHPTLG